jgi:Flp pilus assembly protein TadD
MAFISTQMQRGIAAQIRGDYAAAVGHYRAVLNRKPRHAHALYHFGLVCQQLGEWEMAIKALQAVLQLAPNHADAWYNIGRIHQVNKRPDLAYLHYVAALEHDENHVEALTNAGVLLAEFGEERVANVCQDHALATDPTRPEAQYNRAMIELGQQDWENGWRDHEARWRCPAYLAEHAREFMSLAPRWDGEPMPGKTLLIHWEQGFGDTIQFSRYIAEAIEGSQANVIMEMQKQLVRLIQRTFPDIPVYCVGDELPAFDAHISTASLPSRIAGFGADVPYIYAERNPRTGNRFRVGLCWAGSTQQLNDYNRSAAFDILKPILDVPNIDWLSLQVGERAHECGDMPRIDPKDFADTADAIAGLDLVITVDTSVAHLTGAIGKPVWIMIPPTPDWRYPRTGNATPWYPTAKLYRQPARQVWEPVVEAIAHDLDALVNR